MSIWCSRPMIGTDPCWPDEDEDGAPGDVRSYVEGWSNHYPTTDGTAERAAAIDTASIPAWCVPGHGGDFEEPRRLGPWLRLSVVSPDTHVRPRTPEQEAERSAAWQRGETPKVDVDVGTEPRYVSVVLDEAAVRSLVADLTEWLDTPKVHPCPTKGRPDGESEV